MFSLTSPNVTRTQLRNSSARLSRATHSVKIIGAAAIALLAAGNNLANAAENPVRTAQEQHACAVVLSLDPSGRRYDACMRSLDRSLSEGDYARLVSTDRDTCTREDLHQAGLAQWRSRASVTAQHLCDEAETAKPRPPVLLAPNMTANNPIRPSSGALKR